MSRPLPLLLLGSALVSACATGPAYEPPQAGALAVPALYAGQSEAQSPARLQDWWKQFGDARLDSLIDRGLAGNLDLAIARARLVQARESLVQSRGGRLPTVSGSGQASQGLDTSGSGQSAFSLGIDASWEADLFGGKARAVEASQAEAQAAAYDLAAVRVSLVSDIATYYVQARLAQQRLALARQNLGFADENLQIARWRNQAGLVTSIDVEQARSARAQIAVTLPTLEQTYGQAVFRLGVLTGQAPAALADELAETAPPPAPPGGIAAGFPADTLRQRPDVRSAERSLAAATARIGVAQAQLYPALRIGGTIGTSSISLGGLVDLVTGNLFAALSHTIFDGGQARSQVRSQRAAAEAAFAQYKQTVLGALEDVEKALLAVRTAEQRRSGYDEALEAARNQAILARSSYRAGLSDFQTLLEAERSLISASDGQLVSKGDQTLAVIQLYRALGGGWDPANPAQD